MSIAARPSLMRRHIAAWCIVALGLGALAACAQPAGTVRAGAGGGSSAAGPSGTPSSAAPSSAPAPSKTMKPPIVISPPAVSGGQISLSGQIYAGAEPTCLLIKQDDVPYLLMASDSMKLRVGERAVVTGHVVTGIMTHCMQGRPFEVTTVKQLTP